MKKVVFVVNQLPGGGLEQVLLDAIKALHDVCETRVVTLFPTRGYYVDEILKIAPVDCLDKYRNRIAKIPFISSIYSRSYEHTWLQSLYLDKYLSLHRPDYVIAFAEGWTLKTVAATHYSCHKVAWIHTDFTKDVLATRNKQKKKYIESLAKYEDIIFVSQQLSQRFKEVFLTQKSTIIHNGIDIEKIKRLSNQGVCHINDTTGKINIVCVGRLSYEKGFDRIITSFSHLTIKERERLHLTIIGSGEKYAELNKLVQDNNLNNHITFVGYLENPFPTIKAADVLVAPSRYEGFGLVVLEAMCLGVPCIATHTAGFDEIIDNNKYGILTNNTDNGLDAILKDLSHGNMPFQSCISLLAKRANQFSIRKFRQDLITYFTQT